MQPHTDRPTTSTAPRRGDEADLYQRHHQALLIAVSHAINGSGALIEDACQTAWTILLRRQPDRASVFAWLYVVAIHEAYRLSAIERRELHLEDLAIEGDWETILAGRVTVEDQLEALEALRALARPPRPPTPRPLAARGRLQLPRDRRHDRRTHLHQRQQAPREGPHRDPPRQSVAAGGQRSPPQLFMRRQATTPHHPRRAMGYLSIDLDLLSAAERRDLANALLRAAWSAVLQETRIALLDLIVEVDDTVLGGAA